MGDPHKAVIVAWLTAAATFFVGIWSAISAKIAQKAAKDSAQSAANSERMKDETARNIADTQAELEVYKPIHALKLQTMHNVMSKGRLLHERFYYLARDDNNDVANESDGLDLEAFKTSVLEVSCLYQPEVEALAQEYIRKCERVLSGPPDSSSDSSELTEHYNGLLIKLREEIHLDKASPTGKQLSLGKQNATVKHL